MKLSATAFFFIPPPPPCSSQKMKGPGILIFLPTFEELYQKCFCFVSDIAGILNWVAAPPTSVGLATHSTLVTLSKTRKLRFYFHTGFSRSVLIASIHGENNIHGGTCFDMPKEKELHPAALALWR